MAGGHVAGSIGDVEAHQIGTKASNSHQLTVQREQTVVRCDQQRIGVRIYRKRVDVRGRKLVADRLCWSVGTGRIILAAADEYGCQRDEECR